MMNVTIGCGRRWRNNNDDNNEKGIGDGWEIWKGWGSRHLLNLFGEKKDFGGGIRVCCGDEWVGGGGLVDRGISLRVLCILRVYVCMLIGMMR